MTLTQQLRRLGYDHSQRANQVAGGRLLDSTDRTTHMTDFHVVDASHYTASDLDAIALERGGVISSYGYGYSMPRGTAEPIGGWLTRVVGRQGMGNHGSIVLVATDRRTRSLLRRGTVARWVRDGLTPAQAERLYSVRAPYRHELVSVIVAVLADEAATTALLAHPGTYGSGSGRTEWCVRWAEVLPAEVLRLSAPREAALAIMIAAVVAQAAQAVRS